MPNLYKYLRPLTQQLSKPLLRPITRATMSTATAVPKHEWLCILPDIPGVHEKRLEIRPLHFAGIQALVADGFLTWGGAALNDVPKDNTDAKTFDFHGSVLTAVAATRDEVVARLKEDPYTKHGVWDWEKAQIFLFKCAVREPLKK
ncbi:hypothetical protein BZA05DRAFT_387555 [Tricharina praecox]|uniref:uncharacterized protein n=1 Tax=Tricharina praecox TaxID=43433 RepID=UPI002220D413|nr:uncharacterized protein BZA05DRAFT_387555 [Tricharina praecox]KAI5857198.1 hypothetical protein BZA05DRAFT_387555 [Tricharina praecox]